jgi:hypothetical protein
MLTNDTPLEIRNFFFKRKKKGKKTLLESGYLFKS